MCLGIGPGGRGIGIMLFRGERNESRKKRMKQVEER